jgi:hypothetical protein
MYIFSGPELIVGSDRLGCATGLHRRDNNALLTMLTELKAIAAPATPE